VFLVSSIYQHVAVHLLVTTRLYKSLLLLN
jgi:hypothetical protein